jgi:hypothetical protein
VPDPDQPSTNLVPQLGTQIAEEVTAEILGVLYRDVLRHPAGRPDGTPGALLALRAA